MKRSGKIYTQLSYDGLGRVWQRWEYDTVAEEWVSTLKRFVYDGNTLSQEIETTYEEEAFSYSATSHDYLRKPNGIRDKAQVGENYEDRYLLTDKVQITARVKRETTSSVIRQELTMSGDRQSGGSTQDDQISNLGSGGGYIEGYGGGTSDPDTMYYDPLIIFKESNHYLPYLSLIMNPNIFAHKYSNIHNHSPYNYLNQSTMSSKQAGDSDDQELPEWQVAMLDCITQALEPFIEELEYMENIQEWYQRLEDSQCMIDCLETAEAGIAGYLFCLALCLASGEIGADSWEIFWDMVQSAARIAGKGDFCALFADCMDNYDGVPGDFTDWYECCYASYQDALSDPDTSFNGPDFYNSMVDCANRDIIGSLPIPQPMIS